MKVNKNLSVIKDGDRYYVSHKWNWVQEVDGLRVPHEWSEEIGISGFPCSCMLGDRLPQGGFKTKESAEAAKSLFVGFQGRCLEGDKAPEELKDLKLTFEDKTGINLCVSLGPKSGYYVCFQYDDYSYLIDQSLTLRYYSNSGSGVKAEEKAEWIMFNFLLFQQQLTTLEI